MRIASVPYALQELDMNVNSSISCKKKEEKKMFSDATFTRTTGRIRAHSSACTLRERRDHPTAFITVRLKPLLPRPSPLSRVLC